MSDTNNTANPPAASGGTDKVLQDAITAAVAAAVAPLQAELTALKEAKAPAAADLLKQAKDQLAAEQAAAQAAQAATDKRTAAIASKLQGVPVVYAEKLGSDETKWDDEAKAIRGQFMADIKAAGVKVADVTSDAPAGETKPADMVDLSKLSGPELIALGVKQRSAIQDAASPAADAVAAGVAKGVEEAAKDGAA